MPIQEMKGALYLCESPSMYCRKAADTLYSCSSLIGLGALTLRVHHLQAHANEGPAHGPGQLPGGLVVASATPQKVDPQQSQPADQNDAGQHVVELPRASNRVESVVSN